LTTNCFFREPPPTETFDIDLAIFSRDTGLSKEVDELRDTTEEIELCRGSSGRGGIAFLATGACREDSWATPEAGAIGIIAEAEVSRLFANMGGETIYSPTSPRGMKDDRPALAIVATGLVSTASGADDCGRIAVGRGETNMEMSNADYPPSLRNVLARYISRYINCTKTLGMWRWRGTGPRGRWK